MAKTTTIRTRRGKAELQQEFQKVREEVAAAREAPDAKAAEVARLREAEVRQAVDGISVDSVVQSISALGLQLSKALVELSEKLVREAGRLADLREAIALETRELERLHKIDIARTALDQLVQDYAAQGQALEAEIAGRRAAWEAERKERERAEREYDESLRKQRQREAEDFEYKKALERKKAQDKYDEEIRLLEKKNREKQESLEKTWQQREATLKEREEEFLRLKQEVEQFPLRLQKEAEQAAAQAARAAAQKIEQEMLLLRKDHEADKRLAEHQIRAFEETIARQASQLAVLQKQLDEAKRQVQDIAVKAIEGASGAKALAHVNQIAMEQAKTRAPQA